jgi:hypothetical protein
MFNSTTLPTDARRFAGEFGRFLWSRLQRNTNAVITAFVTATFVSVVPGQALDPPSISTSGSFSPPQTVSMAAAQGTIFYTTDGSTPTNASPEYVAAFNVFSSTQLNAIAYSSGTSSSVTTAYVEINPSLPTPALWLDANSGVTTGSGSLPAVSTWADLSNNSNSASSASGSEPVYRTDSINALPVVGFNGSSQYLSLPSGFASLSNISIFVVTQPRSLTPGAHIFDLGEGSSGNNILVQLSSSGSYGEFWVYSGSSGTSVRSLHPLVQNQYQLLEAVQSGGAATFYVNGLSGAENSGMHSIPVVTRTANYIGRASAGGSYYHGKIAEIILFSSALTESQRKTVEAYLIHKYQLFSSVPSPPVISVPGGLLDAPTQVVVTSQPGAIIRITTDGSTPTINSPVYTGSPISINYSQRVKAIAFLNGLQSGVATATYVLDPSHWPAPNSDDTATPSINLELPVPTE